MMAAIIGSTETFNMLSVMIRWFRLGSLIINHMLVSNTIRKRRAFTRLGELLETRGGYEIANTFRNAHKASSSLSLHKARFSPTVLSRIRFNPRLVASDDLRDALFVLYLTSAHLRSVPKEPFRSVPEEPSRSVSKEPSTSVLTELTRSVRKEPSRSVPEEPTRLVPKEPSRSVLKEPI
nr:hypothetical protein [Tanacetum cinerariifolium]